MRKVLAVAAVLLALSSVGPGSTTASVRLSTPSPGPPGDPSVGANGSGEYVAAWTREAYAGPVEVLAGAVSDRPRRESVASIGDRRDHDPATAVAPGGERLVAWLKRVGSRRAGRAVVMAATSAAGTGRWETRRLSEPGEIEGPPLVAFSAAGGAFVLWSTWDGGRDAVVASAKAPGAAAFGPPSSIARDSLTPSAIAFDASGRPLVVLRRGGSDRRPKAVLIAEATEDGAFGPPILIREDCGDPQVVEAPDGAAVIAMTCDSAASADFQIWTSRRVAGGPFEPAQPVPGAGRGDFSPSIALTGDGRIAVSWLRYFRRSYYTDRARTRPMIALGDLATGLREPRPAAPFAAFSDHPEVLATGDGGFLLARGVDARSIRLRSLSTEGPAQRITPRRSFGGAFAIDALGRGIAFYLSHRGHRPVHAARFAVGGEPVSEERG